MSDGQSDYPLRPTHRLQIDFETGPHRGTTIVVLLVHDGARWHEVLPCPRPEALANLPAAAAKRAQQERRAQSLAAQLADPLRAQIVALTKKGRRIDAIKKYVTASGEDLATAKRVVELLAGDER